MASVITKEMVEKGLTTSLILITTNSMGDIVAQIGTNWFYPQVHVNDDFETPEAYMTAKRTDELIDDIYHTLDGLKESDNDEYTYYYFYLTENL